MAATKLGIANVTVNRYDAAPNILPEVQKYQFDISAWNHAVITESSFIKPLLAEYIQDEEGETFAAYHPAKRKTMIPNMLSGSPNVPSGAITWTRLATPPVGIPKDIVDKTPFYQYTLPSTPSGKEGLGPQWENNTIETESNSNDQPTAETVAGGIIPSSPSAPPTTTTTSITKPSTTCVHQTFTNDGLWWAIQSSPCIDQDDTPFWTILNFNKPPSSDKHETCFTIRIGEGDPTDQYDILISLNRRARLRDYALNSDHTFNVDLARILTGAKRIEVGVMTVAGRLVVIVNNIPLVYTRLEPKPTSTEDSGTLKVCKIAKGSITVFGTNTEASVYVAAMTFAYTSVLTLPVPVIVSGSSIGGGGGATSVSYSGVNERGEPYGCVAELPSPPSYPFKLFGVDCNTFSGDGGTCNPSGVGFHTKGSIQFVQSSLTAVPGSDFYALVMNPDSTTTFAGVAISCGGCPYFFRLKGLYIATSTPSGAPTDISDYLISVDETGQAPDYFHSKRNASLTFYNENNIIGAAMINKQTAVDIAWSWSEGDQRRKTFTGLVTSISKSEIAGKETITVNCEDYTYILKNVPIVNSPFYDGMVGYYAIKDLAERAGINSFFKDWDSEDDYFLPAGYAFSQPKMRFPSSQMIFECIQDILKRFEAFCYFDENGNFHISKLPGGLFSSTSGTAAMGNFYSAPSVGGSGRTILEERNVDISFESTVNCISILTLERNTRNAIFYSTVAPDDKLLFRKTLLKNEAALGELEVAKAWANDLGLRVFYPILKTRFKTSGMTDIVMPLDFVTVDGHMFRVMSVKRSFGADTNDMNCSYECEWLGGI